VSKTVAETVTKTFAKIKNDKFLRGSFLLSFGSVVVGGLNYVYQVLMARLLNVEVYGELQSILAILSITAVFTGTITTVMVKYTADFKAKGRMNQIYSLFLFLTKKVSLAGIAFLIIFMLLSGLIAKFLNLPEATPLLILGIAFFFSFSNSINSGINAGLQQFKAQSAIGITSTVVKLVSAVIFIKLGFELNGAVGAVVLAGVVGYSLSFLPIKFLFKLPKTNVRVKEILKYSLPVFFTLLFTTLLFNVDIILVKHYFPAQTAGEYGALAILGRIIFFMTGPVIGAMFPMVADAHGSVDNMGGVGDMGGAATNAMSDTKTLSATKALPATKIFPAKILKKAILLITLIGAVFVTGYVLFANQIITILVGAKFLVISQYLGWFGLSMFLYSLVSLFSNYFLSIGRVKGAYLVGGGALIEIISIALFHENLWQIIVIMNGVMLLILILLVIYFMKINKWKLR
jgi:O-antigen/teichoic acid export membrane protein